MYGSILIHLQNTHKAFGEIFCMSNKRNKSKKERTDQATTVHDTVLYCILCSNNNKVNTAKPSLNTTRAILI